jgi:PEP-CTERM motif
MQIRLTLLFVLALCGGMALPAHAGVIYDDGPINGTTDAWTINFGFVVSDTFTVSSGNSTITSLEFGAWLSPGDTITSAEVSFTSQPDGGTIYFDQVVNFTQSGCTLNQYAFDVCTETGNFRSPTLPNGTYWLNLQNAVVPSGDPVYWDENSGVGCASPGCPSQATVSFEPIPPESFTLFGNPSGTTPEPSSILLFGSGILGCAGILRRKLN